MWASLAEQLRGGLYLFRPPCAKGAADDSRRGIDSSQPLRRNCVAPPPLHKEGEALFNVATMPPPPGLLRSPHEGEVWVCTGSLVQRLFALMNNYCINLESCLLVIGVTIFMQICFCNINK